MKPHARLVALVTGALVLAAAACGSSESAAPALTSTTTQAPAKCGQGKIPAATLPPAIAEKPQIEVTRADARATSIKTEDLVEGTGAEVKADDCLTANYVGVLAADGKEFDSSWDKKTPKQFQLGSGQVIPGWDQGVPGMKVGGRRRVTIPAALGYGAQGQPPDIPPNANLVFVVDAVDVGLPCTVGTEAVPTPLPDAISQKPEVSVSPEDESATEVRTEDLVVGTGPEIKAGDCLVTNYVRAVASDPSKTESSWDKGKGLRFEVGSGQVIQGWEQGLAGMKVGGRREIVVPAALAYGSKGAAPDIPPDANLVFVVDAVALK